MVSRPDLGDGPGGATVAAGAKVEAGRGILVEFRVGTAAHLACHILYDVLAQEGLDVLRHVFATDDEALVAVDRSLSAQFGHEELEDVLGRPLHHGTDLLEVDPEGLLGADAGELGGLHVTALLLDEVGVVRMEDAHDAIKELGVGVLSLAVVGVSALVGGAALLHLLVDGQQGALFGHLGLGGPSVPTGGSVGRLGLGRLVLLLLLLLLLAQVEHGGHLGLFFGRHDCCLRWCYSVL